MKNTNIKRQAVFPVLVMLVVTALALIGSSFAWFTVANTASIAQITTSAQTDGVQLMLSQDANRYYTRNLKLNTSAAGTIIPGTLYQVSTNGKLADGQTLLTFYDSEVKGHDVNDKQYIVSKLDQTVTVTDGILAAADMTPGAINYGESELSYGEAYEATTPTYIVFDLYMKVDRPADIYLYNGTDAEAQVSNSNNTSVTELLQALRVAFVYLGSTTDGTKIQAEEGLTGNKSVTIWEPAYKTSNGDKVLTYGLKGQSYVNGNDDHEFESYVNGTYSEAQTTYKSDEIVVVDKTNITQTPLFSVDAADGCYSKVRIYVWLEGNDPDCTVALASQYLMLNLAFFAKDATV